MTTLPVISGAEASAKLSQKVHDAITALPEGKVLAVYMRNASTDDNKVIIEFAEKISLSTAPQNALVDFNPGDNRFVQRARRTWLTADRTYAENILGASIPDGEAMVEVAKILPQPSAKDEFRIRIIEFLESEMTEDQKEYEDNYIKQIPSTGQFFYDNETGERVASRTLLVKNTVGKAVKHVLREGEYKSASSAISSLEGDDFVTLKSSFAK